MKVALIDKQKMLKGKWDTYNQFLKDEFISFGFEPKRRTRCVYEIWVQEDEDKKIYEENPPLGGISDGYHSFDELYDHRNLLFINFCLLNWGMESSGEGRIFQVWWRHDETTKGWFILYAQFKEGQQISYHIQDKFLVKGKIPNGGPEWDKHTSKDVLVRLEEMAK
jgi:hypothetical protein